MPKFTRTNPFEISGQQPGSSLLRHSQLPDWVDFDPRGKRRAQHPSQLASLPISRRRLLAWFLLVALCLSILGGRAFYLQLVEGEHFFGIAEGNRIRIRDIKATRGIIYDRYQHQLVENIPRLSLAIIPVDLPNEPQRSRVLAEMASLTGLPNEQVRSLLAAQPAYSYQPVIIQENISHPQAIAASVASSKYPGITVVTESSRHYLVDENGPLSLSHVLGYPSRIHPDEVTELLARGYSIDDFVGRAGLELQYEQSLKGQNGKEQAEVDAMGELKEIIARRDAIVGANLVTTLDLELQSHVEQILVRELAQQNKHRASVVVLNPNTGEVLALVSWPAYDNNEFAKGITTESYQQLIADSNQPLFNRSISGEYPSGSTFKMIVGAAALQERLINSAFGVQSVGGLRVSSWFFPDWKAGGHGWTNIVKALAESVNTFFYIIGGGYGELPGLGVEKIKMYAQRFGLSQKLGIDLPQEAAGFLPSIEWKERVKQEPWYIGDTYHLAIGQGDLLVTPLQVASWTSVFANGGTLYRPYMVKEILDSSNALLQQNGPTVMDRDFIDSQHINTIRQGLRQAVLSGSARRLTDLPTSAAAKTGTAEWSSTKAPHAWVTAFAPYEAPQVVVTVLVEEGGEGSVSAMPIAHAILQWWLENR